MSSVIYKNSWYFEKGLSFVILEKSQDRIPWLMQLQRFKICDFKYNRKLCFISPIESKLFYFFYYIYPSSSD